MATLRAISNWLHTANISSMAVLKGMSRPISLRALLRSIVTDTHKVQHIFVLVLENRAFDHMLGFAALRGNDSSGKPTKVDDLIDNPRYNVGKATGVNVFASTPADFKLNAPARDPGHEFDNVLTQLCGVGATYARSAVADRYPAIDSSGFIASYAAGGSPDAARIMSCFAPEQVPILTALAREFAVCDAWFSSLPGPTWPNRFFIHAATSGGLDDSPSGFRSAKASLLDGYAFEQGTIYRHLTDAGLKWTIFEGDEFPQVLALHGFDDSNVIDFAHFASMVNDPAYSSAYTFIEPNYGHDLPLGPGDYTCGNSQHPMDDVTNGERLIKKVYEVIRNSPHWDRCLLIITYDEHGGFYDHATPPRATAPGDRPFDDDANVHGFDFTQLGVRVPAVVVSPLIPRHTIDHVVHDHTSILATIEHAFGIEPLTRRDRDAADILHLLALDIPRGDAPSQLPNIAESGFRCIDGVESPIATLRSRASPLAKPGASEPVDPTLLAFAHVALMRGCRSVSEPEKAALVARFLEIRTKGDVREFMRRIRPTIREKMNLPAMRVDPTTASSGSTRLPR